MAGSNEQLVPLTDVSQYTGSPGRIAHYYAELAVSSPAVAETIISTNYTYPRRDGQAEWAWVAWINTVMVDLPKVVTNPSTNRALRSLLLLVWPMLLTLRHTGHKT